MATNLLVNVNVNSPHHLESVFNNLQKLGAAKRVHASLFLVTTNVTPRGVKSVVRSLLGETDTVCVAVTTQVLVQQGDAPSDAA